jgi:hypothetical protein
MIEETTKEHTRIIHRHYMGYRVGYPEARSRL